MNSIEFEADVKNHSIKIPEEYSNLESKHLKVIIFEIDFKADKLLKGFYNPRVEAIDREFGREVVKDLFRFLDWMVQLSLELEERLAEVEVLFVSSKEEVLKLVDLLTDMELAICGKNNCARHHLWRSLKLYFQLGHQYSRLNQHTRRK
ncbi:MAG: hypothetical protein DRP87_19955 [Spirochaetes bacterium]|nr:MAG: hypothetical protein DRP87_19955 [Spirochaetota bacterium]